MLIQNLVKVPSHDYPRQGSNNDAEEPGNCPNTGVG